MIITATLSKIRNKSIRIRHISELKDFLCVLPAVLFLIITNYYPVMDLVRVSFTDWNLIKEKYSYVGMKNWKWLFSGSGVDGLLNSLLVTSLYSIGEIAIVLVGGMMLALIFNKMSKGFSVMRAIVFMPRYIAMATAGLIYLWILNTDNGILNYFLSFLGIDKIPWINSRDTALISILMLTGWRSVGYGMMIYLSAMIGISNEYYEAAALDGASAFQKFRYITLPLLSPTTLFLLVTTFISSMKVYQSVDVLTGGGPYRSTEVIVYLIYKLGFVDFRIDRAAVTALFFFVILLVTTAATLKISDRSIHYQ